MLGLPGDPVVFQDAYGLSDTPPEETPRGRPAIKGAWQPGGLPLQESEWAHYMDRIKDLVPDPR
jgi:hypothetical protein